MDFWQYVLPLLADEMKKSGDGFDVDDEYERLRHRQRIHWMRHVGYVIFALIILIGMIVVW